MRAVVRGSGSGAQGQGVLRVRDSMARGLRCGRSPRRDWSQAKRADSDHRGVVMSRRFGARYRLQGAWEASRLILPVRTGMRFTAVRYLNDQPRDPPEAGIEVSDEREFRWGFRSRRIQWMCEVAARSIDWTTVSPTVLGCPSQPPYLALNRVSSCGPGRSTPMLFHT